MPQATFGYDEDGNLVPMVTGLPEAAPPPAAPAPVAPAPAVVTGATAAVPPPVPAPSTGLEPAAPLPDYITGAAIPATPLPPAGAPDVSATMAKIDGFHAEAKPPPRRPPPGSNLPISGTSTQLGADPARTADRISRLDEATQAQIDEVMRIGEARQQRTIDAANVKEEAATRAKQDAQVEQLDAQLQRRAANAKLSDLLIEKDPEVQPNRLLDQMSTGRQIAMVILAAIQGGFAKVNRPNEDPTAGPMRIIQSAIDRDIAAQQKQIESGRIRRGNLISHYQQQGMDAKQAEQAARITIGNAAAAQAEAQALKLGAPAELENSALLASKIRGDATAKAVELDASTDARTVVNRAPAAPAAGRSAADLAEEAYKLNLTMEQSGVPKEKRDEFLKSRGLPGISAESKAEQEARFKQAQLDKESADKNKINDQQAKANDALKAGEAWGRAKGLVRDPATGKWVPGEDFFPPDIWEGMSNALLRSGTPAADAGAIFDEAYGRFRSGGVIGDEERKAFSSQTGTDSPNATRAQLAAKLNAIEGSFQAQLGAGPMSKAAQPIPGVKPVTGQIPTR
jgi:hypothetical protein